MHELAENSTVCIMPHLLPKVSKGRDESRLRDIIITIITIPIIIKTRLIGTKY